MSDKPQTKVAVSVADMARMVGLSRARFYQLVEAGVFPRPERHAETARPYYSEEQQRVVLDVRRRNCGVNGQTVLFYARRLSASTTTSRTRKPRPQPAAKDEYGWLLDALKDCKMTAVTPAQVRAAVADLYPSGTTGVDEGEVFRKVFDRLKDASGPGR